MTIIFIRHTHGKSDKDQAWMEADMEGRRPQAQGLLGPPEAGRGRKDPELLAPELGEDEFLLFQVTQFVATGCSCPRTQTQSLTENYSLQRNSPCSVDSSVNVDKSM